MFEGMDMNALMAQAQKMQEQLMAAQQEQASREFTGSAGGDLVKVTLNGAGEMTDLTIAAEACDPEDPESLAAMVIAAFRAAKSEADESMQGLMPEMPGGAGGGMPQGLGF